MTQKLNVLINSFHLPVGRRILERGFASIPLGRCINITSFTELLKLSTEEPVRCDSGHLDAVDWNVIPPIDEELVEALRPCETVFFEMMNRDEGKGRSISFAERQRQYLRVLQYWNAVLEGEEINFFLSISPPHRFRTYVISCLCKHKNIPEFHFDHTSPIPALFYLSKDWEHPVIGLRERYAELRANPPENVVLSETLERYWHAQTGVGDPAPWFVHDPPPTQRQVWLAMAKSVLRRGLPRMLQQGVLFMVRRLRWKYWERWFRDRGRRTRARAMFRFYDENARAPDLGQRYLYLPFQLQPELTTCPLAGAYADQILIAQLLSALLPSDVLIYVKEHPNQQRLFPDGMCRDLSLYRELLALPNVRLVPRSFDTFALMEHALAVATATGSAGFEALFRGTPFLMFGHDYYQYAPGVFLIRSKEDCQSALQAVLNEECKPTLAELRLFLKALGDTALPGYLDDDDMKRASCVPEDECVENLGGMLQQGIKELFSFP
jgi:hypothetical protein